MNQYVLGLDIGIASVGWAVLHEKRIIDLGVRCFDKAETAKEGESLNLARRQARLLRRRLYRRAWRLTKLARLFKREGLIDSNKFFKQAPSFAEQDLTDATGKRKRVISTWELRVQGLDRLLTREEWARVIYHVCKHRGFHWTSKAEEAKADSDSEGGRVKQGLKSTLHLMQEKGYRTTAEMVLVEFPQAQRNKQGQYDKALSRVLLDKELAALFKAQRAHGNTHANEAFETLIRGSDGKPAGFFWEQKPALSGADLLKMLGKCTFEKSEARAPKASFTAERHVWLTRLNNLRIVVDGKSRPLNEAERRLVLPLPYQTENFKYKSLRNALAKAGLWDGNVRFGGLSYPSAAQAEQDKAKDPEEQTLTKVSAWHEMRLAFKRAGHESIWQQISTPALEGQPELLDHIAYVLSVYKDGAEVEQQLRQLDLPAPDQAIAVLEKISFDKFSNLSLKALRKIVPLMVQGLRYDEAVAQIPEYGHHSQLIKTDANRRLYLPSFYEEKREYKNKADRIGSMKFREDANIPRNPVVLRGLNQARKVVNAIIRQYGSPIAVHIEMARDLSRPMDERNKIKKLQDEFKDRNQKARDDFESNFGYKPKAALFEKWMLYREQQGQCAYSQQGLDIGRILNDPNYVQVDHALPYSRSYDDSKNNKVLVLTRENQAKGNRTPYEYLTSLDGGEEGERWRTFDAWVHANKAYRMAKRNRLLRKNYGEEESRGFMERNLNDTRYICKFFKNYVEEHLQLAAREDGNVNRRCVVVNGQLTAFLRARWGLIKIREESDRHHALDAAVVAACTHGMVKALADYSRTNEVAYLKEGFADPETGEILNVQAFDRANHHFPEPWAHFRHELQARLSTDDIIVLREEMHRLGTYSEEALTQLRTLFVSRAPQRRNGGAVHKETIYAQPQSMRAQGGVIETVALKDLTLKDLDRLLEPHRNAKLYAAIRERLESHQGKGDKAFAPDKPFHKPSKDGTTIGPLVRTIKLVRDKQTGIPIRGGVAKNDSMLRVDVFSKAGKFHLVPVYVHHRVTGLPNRAIVAFKDESEWTVMDEDCQFLFSLYPNDLVRVTLKKEIYRGYYSGSDRATGAINVWAHDRNLLVGKDGLMRIGVKTALLVEKLNVDVLGHIYPAPPEVRRGLA